MVAQSYDLFGELANREFKLETLWNNVDTKSKGIEKLHCAITALAKDKNVGTLSWNWRLS